MNSAFLEGKSVLVADDEKFSRQIVVRHLRDYGDPQVEQAGSGSEALVALSDPAKKCDVAVLDVSMPGVNGLTVLRAIRTGFNGIRRDLPVLMLTGNADNELVSSALLLDVDAFIVKPVSKVALAGRMARALSEPRNVRPVSDYACIPTEERERKAHHEEASDLPAHRQSIENVKPGCVLARDLRNSANALLLPAGVTLSERFLHRLRELAHTDRSLSEVWVS